MNELDFASARQEHIAQVKAAGQDIIDNADKIDGLVVSMQKQEVVKQHKVYIEWLGSQALCMGLAQMLIKDLDIEEERSYLMEK